MGAGGIGSRGSHPCTAIALGPTSLRQRLVRRRPPPLQWRNARQFRPGFPCAFLLDQSRVEVCSMQDEKLRLPHALDPAPLTPPRRDGWPQGRGVEWR